MRHPDYNIKFAFYFRYRQIEHGYFVEPCVNVDYVWKNNFNSYDFLYMSAFCMGMKGYELITSREVPIIISKLYNMNLSKIFSRESILC